MFSAVPLPAQPVDATQALNLSAGVSNCKVSRGRSFTAARTTSRSTATAGQTTLGDLEPLFVFQAFGRRGADARPLFEPAPMGTGG
jgi:hypothetical protein